MDCFSAAEAGDTAVKIISDPFTAISEGLRSVVPPFTAATANYQDYNAADW